MINVTVVLALPDQSLSAALVLEENSCVGLAMKIAQKDPVFVQYKIDNYDVGVFGELCDYQYVLSDGDRIELYRRLKVDAKEQRKIRAKEQRAFAKPGL